jgi:hypothetical protein
MKGCPLLTFAIGRTYGVSFLAPQQDTLMRRKRDGVRINKDKRQEEVGSFVNALVFFVTNVLTSPPKFLIITFAWS